MVAGPLARRAAEASVHRMWASELRESASKPSPRRRRGSRGGTPFFTGGSAREPRCSRRRRFAGLALALVVLAVAAPRSHARDPLALGEVVRLLEAGVSPVRVTTLVSDLGVAFVLDAKARERLESAGATPGILSAIEKAQRVSSAPVATVAPSAAPSPSSSPSPTSAPEPSPSMVPPEPSVTAVPRTAIVVRSNLLEDAVRIDGREVGPSGPTAHEVAPGRHTIEVRSGSGEQSRSRQVTVERGRTETVRFVLPVATSTPVVASTPAATVMPASEPAPVATESMEWLEGGGALQPVFENDAEAELPSAPRPGSGRSPRTSPEVSAVPASPAASAAVARATPRPTPAPTETPPPTASPQAATPTPRPWLPGDGRCRNLDDCISFDGRNLDRAVCGGELRLTLANRCNEAAVAQVCSQQQDGKAVCQIRVADARGTASMRFCGSTGRILWAARNLDSPGGSCWPERLKDAAPVTADVATGGRCTILDRCVSFSSKAMNPKVCGGRLELSFQNTCQSAIVVMICSRRTDGTQVCELESGLAPGASASMELCQSTGSYRFAARSVGDRGEGCWPVGFETRELGSGSAP